tara:strand:+ start:881 stop:1363 length:483 start_codon:yes stop_codon:yes gene_type:complete
MKNDYRNYCLGAEYYDRILLYSGKTENDLWVWEGNAAPRQCGGFGGYQASIFEEINVRKGSSNPKKCEQVYINTVRAVAKLMPDLIVALNINDVGKYSHIQTISYPLFNKIVAFIKGTRIMTERRMIANKRKLARKLAQMKRKQRIAALAGKQVYDLEVA